MLAAKSLHIQTFVMYDIACSLSKYLQASDAICIFFFFFFFFFRILTEVISLMKYPCVCQLFIHMAIKYHVR